MYHYIFFIKKLITYTKSRQELEDDSQKMSYNINFLVLII